MTQQKILLNSNRNKKEVHHVILHKDSMRDKVRVTLIRFYHQP